MASYKIRWKKSAIKDLKKLPTKNVVRIVSGIEDLKENPTPPGSKKIVGSEHEYRIRVGDYRVVYSVFDDVLIVEIVRVAHR